MAPRTCNEAPSPACSPVGKHGAEGGAFVLVLDKRGLRRVDLFASERMSDIDFETADYGEERAVSCAACKRPIETNYWEINGLVACASCERELERAYGAPPDARLYLKGLALGALAAVAGAAGWLLITVFTGYQLGIVAIAIGWLVGFAVSKGTGSRGGRASQGIAVGLTYLAMASPHLVGTVDTVSPDALLVRLGQALVAPVSGGTRSVLSVLILGFGLLQAWQKARSVALDVKGPFRLEGRERVEALP